LEGHGFSHAATTLMSIQALTRPRLHRSKPRFSRATVFLSAVASSRSEEATQSKDPWPLALEIIPQEIPSKRILQRHRNAGQPPFEKNGRRPSC
jgi:hypothetical protein